VKERELVRPGARRRANEELAIFQLERLGSRRHVSADHGLPLARREGRAELREDGIVGALEEAFHGLRRGEFLSSVALAHRIS
jgi:hypothetical protein